MNLNRYRIAICYFLLFAAAVWCRNTLAAPPRIVSADANATAIVLALGGQPNLVALDSSSPVSESTGSLPRIGYHRALSAEGLLALKPTVLIGSDHMGPNIVLDTLRRARVNVQVLHSPQGVQELTDNILKIGEVLGAQQRAEKLANEVKKAAKASLLDENKDKRVAFVLAVSEQRMQLAGKGTAGQALLDTLGVQNVANFNNYRPLTLEGLVELKPDFIVVASAEGQGHYIRSNSALLKATYSDLNQRLLNINPAHLVAGLSVEAVRESVRLARHMQSVK